jgi:hypothetical protein
MLNALGEYIIFYAALKSLSRSPAVPYAHIYPNTMSPSSIDGLSVP